MCCEICSYPQKFHTAVLNIFSLNLMFTWLKEDDHYQEFVFHEITWSTCLFMALRIYSFKTSIFQNVKICVWVTFQTMNFRLWKLWTIFFFLKHKNLPHTFYVRSYVGTLQQKANKMVFLRLIHVASTPTHLYLPRMPLRPLNGKPELQGRSTKNKS